MPSRPGIGCWIDYYTDGHPPYSGEQVDLLRRAASRRPRLRLAWHGPLPDFARERDSMRPKAGHSMIQIGRSAHAHKRCKRSQRHQVGVGIGHNTHLGAGRLVEYPGWNLKPTVGIGTAKITAKNNGIRPVDRLMNSDLRPNHRNSVPWVFSSFVVQRGSTPLGLRRQDARRSL